MHVALRRAQVLVSGEFLDRSRGCASHRQVRTERVPEDVDPPLLQAGSPCGVMDVVANVLLSQLSTSAIAEDPRRSQVTA